MADHEQDFLIGFVTSCNMSLRWTYGIPESDIPTLISVINETLIDTNIKNMYVRVLEAPEANAVNVSTAKPCKQIQVCIRDQSQKRTPRRPSF